MGTIANIAISHSMSTADTGCLDYSRLAMGESHGLGVEQWCTPDLVALFSYDASIYFFQLKHTHHMHGSATLSNVDQLFRIFT